jgi:hypothetical protein
MQSMAARSGESFLGDSISLELAISDRFVNAGQVLKNDATGAKIEMTHFGISHLTVRKADFGPARTQFAAGIMAIKLIVKRRAREQRGVAILLRLGFAAGVDSPAVTNDEHYRASHMRETVGRFRGGTRAFRYCDVDIAPLQKSR